MAMCAVRFRQSWPVLSDILRYIGREQCKLLAQFGVVMRISLLTGKGNQWEHLCEWEFCRVTETALATPC